MGAISSRLPELITYEILSRLPIKSVLQSRCVCKHWCSIIDNPYFAKMHHSNVTLKSLTSTACNTELILYVSRGRNIPAELYLARDTGNAGIVITATINVKKPMWRIANSSNGLVMISSDSGVRHVFNPLTDKYVNVTKIFGLVAKGLFSQDWFGVGFGESNKEFKMVQVSCSLVEKTEKAIIFSSKIEVVTLGSVVKKVTHVVPFRLNGDHVILNGRIHWFTVLNCDQTYEYGYAYILTFDLETEEIGQVPIPEPFYMIYQAGDFGVYQLGVLGGCLCLSAVNFGVLCVMMDYNVKGSWTKCFNDKQLRTGVGLADVVKPLWYRENGEILMNMVTSGSLLSHSQNDSTRELEIAGLQKDFFIRLQAFPFTGTLMLPWLVKDREGNETDDILNGAT